MPFDLSTRHLAGLHAGGKLELDGAVDRLDRHRRAERRLDDRQVDLRVDVVALAHEARIGLDVHEDVDVAGAAAERTSVSFARDSDALAVVDSGGDVDARLPRLDRPPRAVAVGARVLDDHAPTVAFRTGLGADEVAEHAARNVVKPAGAFATRAGQWLRAGLDAVAAAGLARDRDIERHRNCLAARGFDELDLDLGAEVGAALLRVAADRAPEDAVAEERGEDVAEVAHVELRRREAARAQPGVAVAVVERAALGAREHLVRLGDLAEAQLGLRMIGDVGMKLAGEAAKGLLDRRLVGSRATLSTS